jgi:small-conductance mechanosensitive channel
MLISRDLIAKVLRIKKFKEYSMAAKLSAFLNEKFAFLAFVGMISTVLFNYASSNNAQFIFFENMKSVCFLLSAMFLLQMTIALTINVLVIKLESLEINDNAENFTSSRKKNLIWICDVIVISIYFFIACFLLKHLGIDLREHVFHDKFITISLIVFVNILIYKSFKEFTNAVLEKERNDPNSDDYKTKLLTFMPTISVIFNTVLFGTSFLVILANFGIDVSPILATLAVFSASIGLAAKDVIQSFLQGLMLLIEKNLYIGEFVRINDVEGVIEKLSVRVIYLRNPDGRLHVIPYNLVNTITNYSKDYSCCNDELVVGSKEDVGKAIEILKKLIDKMKKEKEFGDKILGDLIIHGLKPFDMAGLKIFWNLKTTPDLSGRLLKYEIYRRLSAEFQKQGVSIPIANAIRLTDSKSAASDK